MKNRFQLLGVLLIVIAIQFSCAQSGKKSSSNSSLSAEAMELATKNLQQYIDDGKLAGISAFASKEGETVYRKNFGFADLENQKPMKDNTIFRIFSMTKPITAAALMTLYDEGKFELDDNVSKYIPEFENTQVYNMETKTLEPQKIKISIRHLLTHTAGFTYGWDQNAYVDSLYRETGAMNRNVTLSEMINKLTKIPLKHQPGTTYEYSVSIDVAGYICEVLAGMPLDEFFKTRIFDPLKMEDSGFYVPEEKHSRFSVLYSKDENNKLKGSDNPEDNFKKKPVAFSGGGGMVSTIDDYARFGQMLLNGGELDGVRILRESTVKMIMSDQLPSGVVYENGGGYGLGGSVNKENGQYGWSGAASTHFVADPRNNMVILAFTQFMPFDIEYAIQFVNNMENAIGK